MLHSFPRVSVTTKLQGYLRFWVQSPKQELEKIFPEAKAKDTIDWPRGASRQRPRPRGLQLWLFHFKTALLCCITTCSVIYVGMYEQNRNIRGRIWLAPYRQHYNRSAETRTLLVSRTPTNFGDIAFKAAGPRVLNYQPTDLGLRERDLSYSRFIQSLKTLLFGYWDQSAVWIPCNCALEIFLLTYLSCTKFCLSAKALYI